ncbi:MAG: hypothetical protein AB1Z98_37810 [Nannocystaceae bacterium]
MSPPQPEPRDDRSATDPEHRRWLPWLVSGAIHAAVLGGWASLPDPPPPEPPVSWTAVELIELPPPPPPPRVEPPTSPEPPAVEEPLSEEPPPSSEPVEAPVDRRPLPDRGSPPPSSASPEEPPAVETPSPPGSGGVSLLGLREHSRAAEPSGSLRPSLPPPPVGSGQVVRRVGAVGPQLPAGRRDGSPRSLAEAGFRRKGSGKLVFRDTAGRFKATLHADGRVTFRDLPVAVGRNPTTGQLQAGMPGMSEVVRSAQGQELYQQEKKRLLEETFDLRLQMAVDNARTAIDRRLKSLYRELLDRWSDDSNSEVSRREALFRRWDECEEGLPVALTGFPDADGSELDQMRREGGEQARSTIEGFIRRHLPSGSEQAFTADELRRFNAKRRSRARFEPYR